MYSILGYDDEDLYVLESRYSSRHRSFKKIKVFPELSSNYKLVEREVPLEPKRIMSVFKERLEKHMDELAELQELERIIDDDRPVRLFVQCSYLVFTLLRLERSSLRGYRFGRRQHLLRAI